MVVSQLHSTRHLQDAYWVNEFLVHRRGEHESPFYASLKLKSERTAPYLSNQHGQGIGGSLPFVQKPGSDFILVVQPQGTGIGTGLDYPKTDS